MTPKARRIVIHGATAALALIVLAPVAWFGAVAVAMLTWTPAGEAARFPRLPPALSRGDTTLAVAYRRAHPFLAEYDRALVILHDGAEVARATLARDTGGYVRLDVRTAPDGMLRVEDRLGARLSDGVAAWAVDLAAARIAPAPPGAPRGEYLGAFDFGPAGAHRFFTPIERPERPPE